MPVACDDVEDVNQEYLLLVMMLRMYREMSDKLVDAFGLKCLWIERSGGLYFKEVVGCTSILQYPPTKG